MTHVLMRSNISNIVDENIINFFLKSRNDSVLKNQSSFGARFIYWIVS